MTTGTRVRSSLQCPPATVLTAAGIHGSHLAHAAAAIRARLPAHPAGRWAVHMETPLMLLATLTALQQAELEAVLLPHRSPGLREQVRRIVDGTLIQSQDVEADAVTLPPLDALLEEEHAPLTAEWQQPVTFLTSGSSGQPTLVQKRPGQLIAEARMLEEAFGELAGERTFCGTTSHQHLYGFTFRVLWPYLSDRLLADAAIRIPGELGAALATARPIACITSPAFLDRAQALLDFDRLAMAAPLLFSSGGPLPDETARRFNRIPGVTLVEIYGSTETGALASRISGRTPEPVWQPLPGVAAEECDGLLQVRARHLDGTVGTEDRVVLSADGFRLLGRRDRIAKVADKRVNLSSLEALLCAQSGVAEARVLVLPGGVLGAMLVPDADGWATVKAQGKVQWCRSLRDALSLNVERVTTPKRWRLVKALPRNSQGKVELAEVAGAFAPRPGAPLWERLEGTARTARARAPISADLPEFRGHFPGQPVVPGVAQLSWAAELARSAFGVALSGSMEAVKFRNPIGPGTELTLTVTLSEAGDKVSFELADAEQTYSSGRLVVAPR